MKKFLLVSELLGVPFKQAYASEKVAIKAAKKLGKAQVRNIETNQVVYDSKESNK